MKNYLLTHDMGTSCGKATLFTLDGKIVATNTIEYDISFYGSFYAQQSPEDWWKAFCDSNLTVLSGINPEEVAGVCVTGQMMGCLAVDKNGAPLYPSIIWADGRSYQEKELLESAVGRQVYYNTVGLRASENFALPKMMWLKKNHPELYADTCKFLQCKDFINFRLTGLFATDPSDAAYMQCMDLHTKNWSDVLLKAADIDREKMPEILPSGTVLGEVLASVGNEAHLAPGTPVVLGTGDGDAAALGAGLVRRSDAYTNIGTSSWVSILTDTEKMDPLCNLSKTRYFDLWKVGGTMQAGGFSHRWMKENLCAFEVADAQRRGSNPYNDIDNLSETSPVGSNGVVFLPYLMGERIPYWDAKMKGAFVGLSSNTNRYDIFRSVLEGVSLHLSMILQDAQKLDESMSVGQMYIMGGGSKSPLWRQIFADAYNLPIVKTNITAEVGTLGNAIVAGLALGIYRSREVVKEFHEVSSVTYPIPQNVERFRQLREILKEAGEALIDINHKLSDFTNRYSDTYDK